MLVIAARIADVLMDITIHTNQKREVIDITGQLSGYLDGSGIANIFAKHTTAALTLADLDPGTDKDYLDAIEEMTVKGQWRHPHDPSHFPDHLWSSIIGPGITVPYGEGEFTLGSWQRIVLIELDGPRDRSIEVTLINSDAK